jgi:hypothetical protein
MPVVTDDQPFSRQSGEPAKAYHGFCHFRDGLTISIDAAWRQHRTACDQTGLNQVSTQRRPTSWARWSVAFNWVARRDAYSAHLDEERRAKFLKTQQEAVERHQRAAQAMLTLATLPARTLLNRLTDPAFQAELDRLPGVSLLRECWRAASIVPGLIATERLALGLATLEVVLDDRRAELDRERAVADRIAADPALTSLAIQLLDGVARPPTPAEGS